MNLLTVLRTAPALAAAALVAYLIAGSAAFAQPQGSETRTPSLEGPANAIHSHDHGGHDHLGHSHAEAGSQPTLDQPPSLPSERRENFGPVANESLESPTIIDSGGNVVNEPAAELFPQRTLETAPGPVDRDRLNVPDRVRTYPAVEIAPLLDPWGAEGAASVKRAGPLPPSRRGYSRDRYEQPRCHRATSGDSQADYTRAMQKLAMLEQYLEQLEQQAAYEHHYRVEYDARDRYYQAQPVYHGCPWSY